MKRLLILSVFLLAACASAPLSNQIEAGSKTVQDLAVQIDRLQKSGIISDEREDQLMDQLKEVNKAFRLAETLAAGCKDNCSNARSQLQAANDLLLKLQNEVPK